MRTSHRTLLSSALVSTVCLATSPVAQDTPFAWRAGDRVCYVGSSLAERMQHDGWLEARLTARFPELGLLFRNLGFAGDEVSIRQRVAGFGTPDEHLSRCEASVVFAFFGTNESFGGAAGLPRFREELRTWAEHTSSQSYDGTHPARLVLFTPLAHEPSDAADRFAEQRNIELARYADVIRDLASELRIACVDTFALSLAAYATASEALCIHGIFLTSEGNRRLARGIEHALCGEHADPDPAQLERLRSAIVERNQLWFQRYRATDGYNTYGGRSGLRYTDNVSNRDVLQRELEILDVMCRNRDAHIHALARGVTSTIDDSNTPPPIMVKTNRPGPAPDGSHTFLDGDAAIAKMHVHDGMRVELFASEREFPELVNPVQMAFDTRGRLWVAVWPTYTKWRPKDAARDALLILEDTDGDGRADRRTVFAGDLHNPTGFEFWNGGVLVAQAPDLMFLEDTDGDDRADRRSRILHGLCSADTHHTANSFVFGPGGGLYFQEGTFHMSQPESPFGPVRNQNGCAWRFDPRTGRIERHMAVDFANPHGHVFDRFGQDIVHDGTTAVPYHGLLYNGFLAAASAKHPHGPNPYERRTRPCGGTEILSSSHFPERHRGNLLVANVIGFRGIQQYELAYGRADDDKDGEFHATLRGKEVAPIVSSDDENFRPVDIEVAPDGSLYFVDWHNPLIGHMQHHVRDPSRDNTHGRVYRVTCVDRPLVTAPPIAGADAEGLSDALKHPDDRIRYRARIELTGRPESVLRDVVARLDASDDPRAALEALWLRQQRGIVDPNALDRALRAADARLRAAAVRVLRHWRTGLDDAIAPLRRAATDPHPLVRCEAVVAASHFDSVEAAAVALDILRRPTDEALRYALEETLRQLQPHWLAALENSLDFAADNPEGRAHILRTLSTEALTLAAPASDVLRELILRADTPIDVRQLALRTLAPDRPLATLVSYLRTERGETATALGRCFANWPAAELREHFVTADLAAMPLPGELVAFLRVDGQPERALARATSPASLRQLFDEICWVEDSTALRTARPAIAAYASSLPTEVAAGLADSERLARFVRIELPRSGTLTLAEVQVFAGSQNVARGRDATQHSTAWDGTAARAVDGNTSGAYGDGSSTHTREGVASPWWEVDLGADHAIDRVVVWNRTDSDFGSRLAGFRLTLQDAQRNVLWQRDAIAAPAEHLAIDVDLDPAVALRHAARRAIAHLDGMEIHDEDGTPADTARAPGGVDTAIMELGAQVYARDGHCATCHQPNGRGLPNLYPPLVNTEWVTGDERRLIKLVLHGLFGEIEVSGARYASPPMPPMTPFRDLLDDRELAAVLTYVRNSWGNAAPPVEPSTVSTVRAEVADRSMFWTPAELLRLHPFAK